MTMTKKRSGQWLLGIFLVLMAVMTLGQAVYFNHEDQRQRLCFQEKFGELSVALDARSELTERETDQNKELWLIYAEAAGLLKDDPTAELPPEEQRKLQIELVEKLLEYREEITKIERERERNPLPPYPIGVCD
jgi:hypothetical protein